MSKYLPLDYYDIHLEAEGSIDIDTEPESSVSVFTLAGEVYIDNKLIAEKTAVKLSDGDKATIKSAEKACQVLWISSKRLNEPVAWGGPIVMNTREELAKAFEDLDNGTFLKDKINY
jgi:hypothetical protein